MHQLHPTLENAAGVYFCSQRQRIRTPLHYDGGLISVPPIPVGFPSFLWIPVEFRPNLPAKISLLPRNCVIPVFTLEWSPESGHQNGTRIQ